MSIHDFKALDEFRAECEAHGLHLPYAIETDGLIHRCAATDALKKLDCSYLVYPDCRGGGFQNFRTMPCWQNWRASHADPLTTSERREMDALVERERAKRQAEIEAQHILKSAEAEAMVMNAEAANPLHPYLVAKGVKPHNLLQHGRSLLIPLTDALGKVWTTQTIQPDGQKRYMTGGRARGSFSQLGAIGRTVIVCEGWATAATLHEITGLPVAAAMNAGNLYPVAADLKRHHPGLTLLIAADDDATTTGNPGLTAAQKAAKAMSARMVKPIIQEFDTGTDFNDMARLYGAAVVYEAIRGQLAGGVQ